MAQIPFLGVETSANDTPFLGSQADTLNLDGVELKIRKGIANGYAPLDGNAKVPVANLPDTASLDAEVDGKITTHNSATTSVHGIANTADLATKTYADEANSAHNSATTSIHGIADTLELATKTYADGANSTHNSATTSVHGIANTATLVLTGDQRLSDPRRPLPYPVLSETLFSGVMAEKRVHTRSYNSIDDFWETNIAVTQLPLVLDTYYDPTVIYEFGEIGGDQAGWALIRAPSVAFGTSNTSGLIFESDDEGVKVMRLGTIVVPPLPNPAPPSPYTPQATFIESFSASITKAGGDWYSSAFASGWDSASPSRNIFNSIPSSDQSELIREWQFETYGDNSSYNSFNVAMASPNILLRCSKRYTSWTNGVSPSVEGNGNVIVEIIFYGIPKSLSFGTTTETYCQGNDSRIANIKSSSINTKDATNFFGNGFGTGGTINTSGKSKNSNAGSPTPSGGDINTSGGGIAEDGWTGGAGGSINTGGEGGVYAGGQAGSRHGRNGGSINTSAGGGSINTRGVGSIELGETGTRTTLNGSASGGNKTITLPNATGTIALTNHAHGNITNGGQIPTADGQKTIPLISAGAGYSSGSALINGIAVSISATSGGMGAGGAITSVTAVGSFSAVGTGFYSIVQSGNTSANVILNNVFAENLPLITTTNGLITTGSFGTTANTFCQGNDVRLGSQTIFTLGGEAKTTFVLGTSYLHGCMPTRGPQLSGSYTSAVLRILGNFTITGISIHQYLPSASTVTLTYQLVRVTSASTVEPLGSSVVVTGNNNLTTSASSLSASLNTGDQIGLMLTLGASGTVPVATAATTILANIYCVPR